MGAVFGDCIGALYEGSEVVTMDEVLTAVKRMEQSKTIQIIILKFSRTYMHVCLSLVQSTTRRTRISVNIREG